MNGITRSARRTLVVAVACSMLSVVGTAFAASSEGSQAEQLRALREEVAHLRTEIAAMHGELRAIIQRLGGRAPAQRAKVGVGGGVVLGDAHAPVTMVEFSDYQCPFCRRFHDQTFSRLKAKYIDTGKVRYVFRDFPLNRIHPQARIAAEAAHCFGDQGKYWQAHDVLFQNQRHLQAADLKSYAKRLGLDMKAFDDCLDSNAYAKRVEENVNDGVRAGVRGTPTFVIGRTRKDGTVSGLLIGGARPFEDFQQEIDRLLSQKS